MMDEIHGLSDRRTWMYKGTSFSEIFREGITKRHSQSMKMKAQNFKTAPSEGTDRPGTFGIINQTSTS